MGRMQEGIQEPFTLCWVGGFTPRSLPLLSTPTFLGARPPALVCSSWGVPTGPLTCGGSLLCRKEVGLDLFFPSQMQENLKVRDVLGGRCVQAERGVRVQGLWEGTDVVGVLECM